MFLRNTLIALGAIALVAGMILAAIWLSRSPTSEETAQKAAPTQSVLVAARSIAAGTLLRAEDVEWKEVALGTVAPGNILRAPGAETGFFGAVARRDFAAGEALVASALIKPGDRNFLSAVLSPGERAVSIAVDAPESAAGLVLPGDCVDLILTQSFAPELTGTEHKAVGETVLQNVRVIAVDQRLNAVAKPDSTEKRIGPPESQIPRTVTLEVNEADAERILVAVQLGKVELSVHAIEGAGGERPHREEATAPIWASDVSPALRMLKRNEGPPGAPATVPPSPETSRRPIEVMHGSKIEIR